MNCGDNLLECRSGSWKCTPLYNAVYWNKTGNVKELLKKDAGRAILLRASWDGGYGGKKLAFTNCSVFHQCISNWYTGRMKAEAEQVFTALMEHASKGLDANNAEEREPRSYEKEYPPIQNITYLTKVIYPSLLLTNSLILFTGTGVNYDIHSY